MASIKATYTLTEDWSGNLYCGIKLDCDYVGRTAAISMPGYIAKKLQEYNHVAPTLRSPRFSSGAQRPLQLDVSPRLNKKGIRHIQKIVGSILYYARAVNMTVLMELSTIAIEQTKA